MNDDVIQVNDLNTINTLDDTDKFMVTHAGGLTETITAETLFKNGSKTILLTKAEYNALPEKKADTIYAITDEDVTGSQIDQTYNPASANAQSGVAINGALANYTKITTVTVEGHIPTTDETIEAVLQNYVSWDYAGTGIIRIYGSDGSASSYWYDNVGYYVMFEELSWYLNTFKRYKYTQGSGWIVTSFATTSDLVSTYEDITSQCSAPNDYITINSVKAYKIGTMVTLTSNVTSKGNQYGIIRIPQKYTPRSVEFTGQLFPYVINGYKCTATVNQEREFYIQYENTIPNGITYTVSYTYHI